jgi:heptosyltransferase-2
VKSIDPKAIGNIIIRGTNWIGDAVISIPAMREIGRIFPNARVSLLVKPWVRDVYSDADFVDELIEFEKEDIHRGWRGMRKLAHSLRSKNFDLAILFQNAFEAAFLAWLARIPRRLGYARDGRSLFLTHPVKIEPEVLKVHQAYYYLGILSGAGLIEPRLWEKTDYELNSDIGVTKIDRDAAQKMLLSHGVAPDELLVALNPGATYGSAKRWFADRYASVARYLVERHRARIVILGSKAERSIADEISAQIQASSVNLAGETTLGQLMGILRECSLFITNDSGPMHLAAAMNVPQLAIFGSTSEIATGPLSKNALVIKNPVDCNPCFLRECPVDFECMDSITVEQVSAAADRVLEQIGAAEKGKG